MGVVIPVATSYLIMPYTCDGIEHHIYKSGMSAVLPMNYFETYSDM